MGEGTREKGRGGVAAERDEHEEEGGGWGGTYGRPDEDKKRTPQPFVACPFIACPDGRKPNPTQI